MNFPHQSVLKEECLKVFEGQKIKVFVDCTLGAGGHAEALLTAHPEIEIYVGIDQDPEGLRISEERLKKWKSKVQYVRGNFDRLNSYLDGLGIKEVDGILIDLGVSSMQLDQPEKGFSFMKEGPLDMRMDPSQEVTAAEIINTWSEEELGRIFRDYGEEKQWRRAARVIVESRSKKELMTTKDLVDILHSALYRRSKPGLHPLTLIFQALRICVNRELEVIEKILPTSVSRLAPKGRLAVISFHSLEDRIVKHTFQEYARDKENTTGLGGIFLDKEPLVNLLSRKPIIATEEEVSQNPRSRSAKLRCIEKR